MLYCILCSLSTSIASHLSLPLLLSTSKYSLSHPFFPLLFPLPCRSQEPKDKDKEKDKDGKKSSIKSSKSKDDIASSVTAATTTKKKNSSDKVCEILCI